MSVTSFSYWRRVKSHVATPLLIHSLESTVNDFSKTTVLSILDWFSKVAYFIALEKLPTVTETANLSLKHVYILHGIPSEILSDWAPRSFPKYGRPSSQPWVPQYV